MRAHERSAHSLVLAIPLTLLSTVFLLGCQEFGGTDPIGPDGVGPEFSHKPGHGGGGGADKGGAKKGDILTVRVEDGLVTPVSPPQEVEVTFINKTYFRVETGTGVHTFTTATNLDDTQEDVNGSCFTEPPNADSQIIDTLRARLVHPPRLRGFTMVVDKRGLDAAGSSSESWQNRLYTSWREPAFGLDDTPIHLQLWPEPFGDVTVVLERGSFDNIAEGVDLTFLGGSLRAWTPDPEEFPLSAVTLYCPNVDEFKVFVRVPTP